MTVTLRFEDGAVVIDAADDDLDPTTLPHVERDGRTGSYRVPAHRYREVRDILREQDADVEDQVNDLPTLDLDLRYDLRDYQQEALDAWHDIGEQGVVELPTGSGKTVLALAAVAELGVPTLVVVPTIDLLDQWRCELESEFDVPVGQFGGGEQRAEALTVATYDSAYLRAENVGGDFGLVVFDEVHHLGGEGYRDIARLFTAPARLGLTATFERPDGAHEVLTDLVGPVAYELDVDDLAGDHLAEYEVRRIEVELSESERDEYEREQGTFVDYVREAGITFSSGSDYQELVYRSGSDPRAREALLAKQRAREVMMNADAKLAELERIFERHRGERIIVFTAHTELVYRLSERFLVPAITSETGAAERREILRKFREGEYTRVVAANVLDEGVDVPDASVGVVISGSGSQRQFTQRLGRVLRPGSDGDKRAVLYELVTSETAEERVADRRR